MLLSVVALATAPVRTAPREPDSGSHRAPFEFLFENIADGDTTPREGLAEHPEIDLREAFYAEISGDPKAALDAYQRYFEESGEETAHARASYAKLLAANRRYPEAVEQLDRAMEIDPADAEFVVARAEILRESGQSADARKFLESVLYRYEDEPGIEFQLGELYYEAREYERSRLHHTKTLFHLDNAGSRSQIYRNISLWRLADLNLRADRFEDAQGFLERYVRYNPGRHYPRFILADRLYFRRGLYTEALRELETLLGHDLAELLEQNVDVRRAYSLLARLYFYFEDVRFYETMRFIKSLGNGKWNAVERGLFAAHQKHDAEALQYLLAIVKRYQDKVYVPWVAILRVLERSDRQDLYVDQLVHVSAVALNHGPRRHREALAWLRKAEDLREAIKEQNPDAGVAGAYLYRIRAEHYMGLGEQHFHRAAVAYGQALEAEAAGDAVGEEGEREQLLLSRAAVLAKIGREDEALRHCAGAGEIPRAFVVKATILHGAGRLEAAEGAYTRAIELAESREESPDRLPAAKDRRQRILGMYHYFRAGNRYERGDFDGAVQDLRLSMEYDSDLPAMLNFRGYLVAESGQSTAEELQQARGWIQTALKNDPTNGHYQDSLGRAFYRAGKMNEARYHLAFALRLLEAGGEPEPEVLSHLGDVYAALERTAEARTAYERALILLDRRRASQNKPSLIEERLYEYVKERLQFLKAEKS